MAFIVFEGLDGSGKSTQLHKLAEHLRAVGKNVIVTREPGGTPLAEELRALVLRKDDEVPSPRCELLVYEASRAQHVSEVIRPALDRGDWVISDRFTGSSVAFQSGGRAISKKEVEELNDFATGGLRPDLNILIDVTIDESEARRAQRSFDSGIEADRMESEKRQFHEGVRNSFLEQASTESNWLKVDGAQPVEEIFAEILKTLKEKKWLES